MSQNESKKNDLLVYSLVIARIALILLPQNEWGQMPGNFTFSLIRNIPFAILGVLLIIWSWQDREKPGLKYMAESIFFSFLFYVPVVLWADTIPIVGALMMPKTVAYVFLVLIGYKHFIKEFDAINILKLSFVFLVMGLSAGVFYREFTKFNDFYQSTPLSLMHVHAVAVGFISLLLLYSFVRNITVEELNKNFKKPIFHWVGGLYFTIVTMGVRGISDVVGEGYLPFSDAAFSGIAGIGHIILGIGLVWTVLKLIQHENNKLSIVK